MTEVDLPANIVLNLIFELNLIPSYSPILIYFEIYGTTDLILLDVCKSKTDFPWNPKYFLKNFLPKLSPIPIMNFHLSFETSCIQVCLHFNFNFCCFSLSLPQTCSKFHLSGLLLPFESEREIYLTIESKIHGK
jgi:hypothetical protein